MTYPKRGSVYLVNFDPTIGAEIKKTRPAVIISNDIANQYSPIIIVAAITSRGEPKFDEVLIKPPEGGLAKSSVIQPNQIRSIDKRRLSKKLGDLSKETINDLDIALQITLGLMKF
ncbi:MAG: type II toxin-antitoxin system PemK/MazF family toxin [Candidatus Aerophobetes bacterium]|nr:type II toxin-antitoxin system PemK/MazF family toxin [Candidatus Aerophobetes bacterium]